MATAFLLLAAAVASGCSRPADAQLDTEVWSVQSSNAVAPGSLYVFLPGGLLVMTSPGSRVGIGSWKRDAAGALTMVEESRPYAVDVLELTPQRLRLRSHNPGTPVDLTLAPAAAPPPVPARFQGEWNAKLQDCGAAGGESRLRLGADTLQLHEGSGKLRAVLPQGDDGVAVVAQLTGEAGSRLVYRNYRLSADRRSLSDIRALRQCASN